MSKPLIIGLTGGIGVGKSSVASALASYGAEVIDVDGLGREVLEPGGAAHDAVLLAFGDTVRAAEGGIDRQALAAEVFGPGQRLDELEAISHPAINSLLGERVGASSAEIIVLDMAVLAESQLARTASGPLYQRVVVVEAPLAMRLPRLVARGMTVAQAEQRMAAQAGEDERRVLADLVITNDSTLVDLEDRIAWAWPTVEAWKAQASTLSVGQRQR